MKKGAIFKGENNICLKSLSNLFCLFLQIEEQKFITIHNIITTFAIANFFSFLTYGVTYKVERL